MWWHGGKKATESVVRFEFQSQIIESNRNWTEEKLILYPPGLDGGAAAVESRRRRATVWQETSPIAAMRIYYYNFFFFSPRRRACSSCILPLLRNSPPPRAYYYYYYYLWNMIKWVAFTIYKRRSLLLLCTAAIPNRLACDVCLFCARPYKDIARNLKYPHPEISKAIKKNGCVKNWIFFLFLAYYK